MESYEEISQQINNQLIGYDITFDNDEDLREGELNDKVHCLTIIEEDNDIQKASEASHAKSTRRDYKR